MDEVRYVKEHGTPELTFFIFLASNVQPSGEPRVFPFLHLRLLSRDSVASKQIEPIFGQHLQLAVFIL
jgi:hypothetical protein